MHLPRVVCCSFHSFHRWHALDIHAALAGMQKPPSLKHLTLSTSMTYWYVAASAVSLTYPCVLHPPFAKIGGPNHPYGGGSHSETFSVSLVCTFAKHNTIDWGTVQRSARNCCALPASGSGCVAFDATLSPPPAHFRCCCSVPSPPLHGSNAALMLRSLHPLLCHAFPPFPQL